MPEIIDVVKECWKEDPKRVIAQVVTIIMIFILIIAFLQPSF
jgi:hypothetical protein